MTIQEALKDYDLYHYFGDIPRDDLIDMMV